MPGRATASSGSVGQASVSRGNAPYMVAVTVLLPRAEHLAMCVDDPVVHVCGVMAATS
jgi:hypothetical protein